MSRAAAAVKAPDQRKPSPSRRWDIDYTILALLEPGSKTASGLFRELNPGTRRGWVLTPGGWKRRLLNVEVDRRVLRRHLRYLQRDGLVSCEPCLKILQRNRSRTTWLIKLYGLRKPEGGGTPPPSHPVRRIRVSKIHNPFKGEEGMIRFTRWMRSSG